MHEVNNVIVHNGKIELTHLPFANGQHVRVTVAEVSAPAASKRIAITRVRELLHGGVERFDDPFEPMIPIEDWEMLK